MEVLIFSECSLVFYKLLSIDTVIKSNLTTVIVSEKINTKSCATMEIPECRQGLIASLNNLYKKRR